jgi:hypothetical protein
MVLPAESEPRETAKADEAEDAPLPTLFG